MRNIQAGLITGAALLALVACGNKEKAAETPAAPKAAVETGTALLGVEHIALPDIVTADLASHIETLASDEFEGRAPASKGGKKTTQWLVDTMKNMGLEPGNGDSYLQAVPLVEVTAVPAQSNLTITTADGASETLAMGSQTVYWTKRVEEEVSFDNSDLVFVGHGVVAPEYGWDDYAGMDVKGKTVVILVNDPGFRDRESGLFNGKAMTYYGRWTYKYEEAARQGAAAALVIHQTEPAAYGWGVVEGSWQGPQLDLERPDGGASRVVLEGWVTNDVATDLFAKAGMNFADMEKAASKKGFKPVAMTGLSASGHIFNVINHSESNNVAGMIKGSTHPDEYVLYMAHWDHLGRTFAPIGGGSAAGDTISNGAVDNATGSAGILSIAQSFLAAEKKPERSILFIAVTAEESGLLGSAYFAEDPFVPFNKIIGGINIDGMLPTGPSKDIIVVGYGASQLEDLLKKHAEERGMYLRPDTTPENGYFYRSDHISLAKKGVPMLYADAGLDLVEGGEAAGKAFAEDYTANRYHKPSDEYSSDWDLRGIVETLEVLRDTGADMAYSDIKPNWYEGNEFRALRDEMMK